jgi:hypothetical protein
MLDATQHLEPTQLRHLNVEKNQIGPKGVDRGNSTGSIRRLTDALDPADTVEQVAQLRTRDWLVLDDERACPRHASPAGTA